MSSGSAGAPAVPATVLALGAVSFLMDASSELIHSLLPLFLVGTLGVAPVVYGLIEGVAEASVMVVKVLSGTASDWMGRRKPLVVAGYGLAAAAKPLFPLASGAALVFVARILDRVGKGIRGAPRDALIADVTPAPVRGAAYGLRQALDSAGAVVGPLLAFLLLGALADDVRRALWWAAIPAGLAVVVLVLFVKEPSPRGTGPAGTGDTRARPAPPGAPPFALAAWRRLPRAFWLTVLVGTVFMLARFSEGFLLLRASELGVATREVPLALAGMSLVYALAAWPAGHLSDRLPREVVLGGGALVLALADALLAAAGGLPGLAAGVGLWGLHLGLTQGVLAALVADSIPPELRGTGFGLFSLASGGALLGASAIAGLVWQTLGSAATFWTGSGLALATVTLLVLVRPSRWRAA